MSAPPPSGIPASDQLTDQAECAVPLELPEHILTIRFMHDLIAVSCGHKILDKSRAEQLLGFLSLSNRACNTKGCSCSFVRFALNSGHPADGDADSHCSISAGEQKFTISMQSKVYNQHAVKNLKGFKACTYCDSALAGTVDSDNSQASQSGVEI